MSAKRSIERAAQPLIVVCGPTAAGKSALAMRLAEVLPITIVSADSRQIYRRFERRHGEADVSRKG